MKIRFIPLLLSAMLPFAVYAAWPTDDLTNTHTDQSTDDPAQARAEINAAILKIKAILAEVTAGATIWHTGNDGSGSGLDADTVDSFTAAYLLGRGNHTGLQNIDTTTTGTLPVGRGGSARTTATARAPIIGGTTSTGAHQSVALGAAGTVLTSNGTGANPTFQTPTATGLVTANITTPTSGSSSIGSGQQTVNASGSVTLSAGQTLVVRAYGMAYANVSGGLKRMSMQITHNGVVISPVIAAGSAGDWDGIGEPPVTICAAVSVTPRTGTLTIQVSAGASGTMTYKNVFMEWQIFD